MRLQSPSDLLLNEVQDLYDAEKQLLRALPKLAKSAAHPELADAFKQHADVTRSQIQRLEQIFEMLGKPAKSHPCQGMKGIVQEASELTEQKSALQDCALAGAGRKAEHYEMAAYLSAQDTAKGLGQKEAAQLLAESLEEEKEMDKRLKQLGTQFQKEASSEAGRQSEGESKSARGGRNGARESQSQGRKSGNGQSNGRSAKGGNGSRSSRGSKAGSQTTTDPEEIRRWAEERGAHPACVKGTGKKGDTGMIRLDFPGYSGGDSLQEISWDEFFQQFEENQLALVYQDKTSSGQKSNFNKLVRRESH